MLRRCAVVALLSIASGVFAADANKVIRLAFAVAETGFDPVAVHDLYSNTVLDGIVEPMLSYDYLARPAKLIANTLASMPEVSDNGATFTFRLKRGIVFADDAAFGGKPRELVAADYAYSIKRLFDPKLKSPWLFLLEGKILGLDDAMAAAKKNGDKFDYDTPIAGLEILDLYTLRVRLKQPDYNLLYIFAMPTLGALAREVVERYGGEIGQHPVGTGPYQLHEWKRGSKMVLLANNSYREDYFAGAAQNAQDQNIIAALKGKRLPLIGRVEISIIEESQPRWLEFLNGNLDYSTVPGEFANLYIPGGKPAPSLLKRGVSLHREIGLDLTYSYFNMLDPIVGGYEPHKVALRRAISLAYNTEEEIRVIRKNQAIVANSPVPPGVAGFDEKFRNPLVEHNPAKAKAMLDVYGYKDVDGDGYRELPDGTPLVLEYGSPPDSSSRQFDTLWQKNMRAVGLRIKFKKEKWPELLKLSKQAKLQMKGSAWSADYPDGDNFLQLLYGPNAGQANDSRFDLAQFNALYARSRTLPDSPERTKLFQEMTKVMQVYAPWKLGVHRIENIVVQPWVRNFKRNQNILAPWKYLDIDSAKRAKS